MARQEEGTVEAVWEFLTAAVTTVTGRNGLGAVLMSLGSLGMILVFAGWVVTRPNTGSFKIGPRGIEWTASSEPTTAEPKEPEAPKPKRWLRRKPPPDS
jgi:hypothetical protein